MAIRYAYLVEPVPGIAPEYGLTLIVGTPFAPLVSTIKNAYIQDGLFQPVPSPPAPANTPTIVGELPTGDTVTLTLYDSNMNAVALTSASCTQKAATGFFYWASTNMTTFPTTATIYFWVMDGSSGRRDYGTVEIGDRPTPELGSVWDKLTVDHTIAGSFGERVDAVPTAVENRQEMDSNSTGLSAIEADTDRVDGLIEDDGSGNDRFTAKALEEGPTGGSAPTKEEIRIEMDDHSTKLSGIKGDTEDIKEIIENLPREPEEWNQ